MPNDRNWRWLAALPGLAVSQTQAAPVEGETASNAAALLIVLGVWAIAMGVRNLRELRYKRLVPERQQRDPERTTTPGRKN
jgi:hypothetical protein